MRRFADRGRHLMWLFFPPLLYLTTVGQNGTQKVPKLIEVYDWESVLTLIMSILVFRKCLRRFAFFCILRTLILSRSSLKSYGGIAPTNPLLRSVFRFSCIQYFGRPQHVTQDVAPKLILFLPYGRSSIPYKLMAFGPIDLPLVQLG